MVGGGQWEDVPGVGGDYVGGDEVDAGGGVGDSVGGDVAFVGVAALVQRAFDLDADEVSVVVDGEVVGGSVVLLLTPRKNSKYSPYQEAWHLLLMSEL